MTPAQKKLVEMLDAHVPLDATEDAHRRTIRDFVAREERAFDRRTLPRHVTGSAFIVDPRRKMVLLHHHRKLDKWLQMGGHDDGACDAAVTALREAHEESGLTALRLAGGILDVDVHDIPARKDEPAHQHLDVRFLVVFDGDEVPRRAEAESHALQWFPLDGLAAVMNEPGAQRVARRLLRGVR